MGIILRDEKDWMWKLIYRALRGNALVEFKDIQKPFWTPDGREELKSVFFVFF